MISRFAKSLYYATMKLPMRWNGAFYRACLAPRKGVVKVHLGPGQGRYIDGWINVDANLFTAKLDVWADLCNPLPFRDATVDAFYSHHMIEHLPDAYLPSHFAEVFRCLKAGGAIRIAGPNGDSAIHKFIEGDKAWFDDWPDQRKSIGGRFNNLILCQNEHLSILTESWMRELAEVAGFRDYTVAKATESTEYPDRFHEVLQFEREPNPETPHTLVIEAMKPL